MTLMGAINHVDAVKPNGYSPTEKIKWLSTLDGIIKTEIIDTHEGGESKTFKGYDEMTTLTQELLVPPPYDEIYIRYLEMQIDYANGELNKYNNTKVVYNQAFSDFENYYNRTHKPISKGFTHF